MSRIEAAGRDLHDLMHRIPGVPEHVEAARQPRHQPHAHRARADAARRQRSQRHTRVTQSMAHHDPAGRRVLPGVQAWIEQLVTGR